MNTNKYQEALLTLTDWFHSYTDANGLVHEKHIDEEYKIAKDTLQELIDKQECFELYFSENHKKQFNEFYERWKKGYE